MATRTRRSFRPTLGHSRLEDRVVLSAAAVSLSAGVTAAAVDPLVQPGTLTVKGGYLKTTSNMVHSAYNAFLKQYNAAVQKAIVALGNGQNEANLVASLKDYTSLQGGVLEGQLQRISRRFPGGESYLYNAPLGTVPGGYPKDGSCGPDIRYFAHPEQRLKTLADNLIAKLTAVTTLQQASGPVRTPLILKAYQDSRASVSKFVNCEIQNNILTVTNYTPPSP